MAANRYDPVLYEGTADDQLPLDGWNNNNLWQVRTGSLGAPDRP
jgi:hypothetical protein